VNGEKEPVAESMKPAGTVQAKRNGTVVEAQHSTLAAKIWDDGDGARRRAAQKCDKGTKRKRCCTRVLAVLPAECFLGLWFFAEGASFVK